MTIQDQLNDLRNQFRGIVSSIRSSGYRKKEASQELAVRYWPALKTLLLHARTILPQDQYQEFFEWVSKQEASLLSDIRSASKGYEQLSGIANSRPTSLETEVAWSTALLVRHKNEIAEFRRVAARVTRHVLRDEFADALQCLDELDESFGVSLWSVQLRIALTNEAYGLEAQKKVVEDVRAVFDRGLLGYIAYFCGVRNESRTTAERFTINTEARISRHRHFSREVKNYLRFALLGESPAS
ncbi:MAG: hypothetical protein AAFQ59_09790 [Pseudomonadota bacterium]